MSKPANPAEIVRCLKRDMDGDLAAGATYARRIAQAAKENDRRETEKGQEVLKDLAPDDNVPF